MNTDERIEPSDPRIRAYRSGDRTEETKAAWSAYAKQLRADRKARAS